MTDPNLLEVALDAAVAETKRLSDELVQAKEGLLVTTDLLKLLIRAWRSGEDLTPIVAEVEAGLERLRRVH